MASDVPKRKNSPKTLVDYQRAAVAIGREADFVHQQQRDAKTTSLSAANGIQYFTTSYHYTMNTPLKMELHLREQLLALDIPVVVTEQLFPDPPTRKRKRGSQ